MSHYKPYPCCKDSGVEWLGRVPEHWTVGPYKATIQIENGSDYKEVEADDGYPVIGSGGPFAYSSKLMYDGESVLLGRKGTIDKPLYVDGPFWAVDTMYWSIIKPGAHGRFAYYIATTIPFDMYSTNTALPSMTKSVLGSHVVAFPDFEEQRTIADQLDRETARIDALIEKKTRFIELLREKRQALITHAVTKGIDPNVKMKDSGVEWLRDVPEHWVCKKLMYWMDGYGSGTTPSKEGDYCVEGGLPWVTTGELREGLISETDKRVTDVALSEYSALKAHPVGSLVIAMYGATVGRLGLLGVPAALNQACFAIHPCNTISIRLLRWWFEGFRAELIELATGAGQPNISGDKIRNLFIAAPLSLVEQELIADQIESRTLRIDGVVKKTERSIELLKERRSALITAAVTGQIDLR